MAKAKPRASKDKGNGDYQADSIQVLKGLEAVRRRPAMYIGSVSGRGLHHLVYEVVDNSVDEALAGYSTQIDVTIHTDNAITVVDNGRGIPVDIHKTEKKPGVEVALTVLHAGGKFDKSTYKVSGGLHGVGVSVVNALSEKLEVWVDRDGKRHHMAFERGDTTKKLEVIGKAKGTGTTVWFKPDTSIFTETRSDYATLANRLRELAFLNKSLTITLKDERKGQAKEETFFYKGGLAEFVKYLLGNRKPLHPKPIVFDATREGVQVEGAIQYDEGYNENTFSFVNNINTHEGGTHLTGFKAALTRTINEWAKKDGLLKKEEFTLTGDDIREGLTCVLHVKVKDPQFEGQTKTKLGNSEVEGIVKTVVNDALGEFLDKNPSASLTTVFTMPSTSELPSLDLVCPSNCGAITFTCSTQFNPSRTSSPESVNSSFLSRPSCLAHSLIVRVNADLKPVRCVPPSCVLMLLTKVNVFSLYWSSYCTAPSTSTSSRVASKVIGLACSGRRLPSTHFTNSASPPF